MTRPATASILRPSDASILDRLRRDSAASPGRPAESLLLLLDGSSSMFGASWHALREAVSALALASSPAHCRLAIAIFAGDADVHLPFTEDMAAVRKALPGRPPGGGTAMRSALEMASGVMWPTSARRIVLLSDGMPTSGDPVPAAKALAAHGVTIDTVACGDADEVVLRAISAAGLGRHVTCRDVATLAGVFRSLETRARALLPGHCRGS